MIYGLLNQGSGLGNQLFRMIATRVRAADLGVDWRMIYKPDGSGKEEGFKGKSFMDYEKEKIIITQNDYEDAFLLNHMTNLNLWLEKKVVENGVDIRSYDPEFNFIEDNTIIEGEFQSENYFMHRIDEINEWLKVEPLEVPDDVCVIGFRGGEYKAVPDLYLPAEYWDKAIVEMRERHPHISRFEVHTDDVESAKKMLDPLFYNSGFKVSYIHDIGLNWRSVRYAKYAIIANSSFYILPRLLRHNDGEALTLAPRFWARRNTKTWALPSNYYPSFRYI